MRLNKRRLAGVMLSGGAFFVIFAFGPVVIGTQRLDATWLAISAIAACVYAVLFEFLMGRWVRRRRRAKKDEP